MLMLLRDMHEQESWALEKRQSHQPFHKTFDMDQRQRELSLHIVHTWTPKKFMYSTRDSGLNQTPKYFCVKGHLF